jgi:hypothetical protein
MRGVRMNPLAPVETTGVQKTHKNGEWRPGKGRKDEPSVV